MNLTRRAYIFPLLILSILASNFAQLAFSKSCAAFQSQEAQSLDGKWEGVLSVGGTKLRLVLHLKKSADSSYAGALDSPDQGASGLKIDSVAYANNSLRFEMRDIGATYEGVVSRDGAEIVGRWKQGPLDVVLIFRREGKASSGGQALMRGRVKLEPCNLPQLPQEVRCGKYEVYEDRAAGRGRKIALNILVMPATGEKPAADPVFFIAGGPGQGSAQVAVEAGDFLPSIRREREIVFVDQRGTGESNPLQCNFFGDRNDMRGYFREPFPLNILRSCRAELEKVANLALYTTPLAMDDLEEVRAAMGYERINLYGGSYGTNAALVYLRQHPARVRSVVLKGVAPTDYKMPLHFSKGVQHALDRLVEDCAQNVTCHKAFPKLKEELTAVVNRLDKTPATFAVINPVTGVEQQVTMTRAAFVDNLRVMLYVPDLTSMLPVIIHRAYEKDFAPFATYAFILVRQIDAQIARGMQLSVICSEHVPFITDADIARETSGTYYGNVRIKAYKSACSEWPAVKAPQSFLEPVKSDVPVLTVSGDVDPVTPPAFAAAAARTLPNSRQIIIRDGTHLTASDCIDRLVAEFLSKGNAQGLDDSCVKDIKRPAFILQLPAHFDKK